MYFKKDLVEYVHYNLMEQDWEILEGLEEVLEVSYLFNLVPNTGTHRRDRSLTYFSNACYLNPCLYCCMQSSIWRSL